MKNLVTLLLLTVITNFGYAQTNTFPSTGNTGIGTTTPNFLLDIQKAGGGSTAPKLNLQGYINSSSAGAYFNLGKSRGTTIGSFATTSANDLFGVIDFYGVNANATPASTIGARIIAGQDNIAAGTTYVPGYLSLFTSDATNGSFERFRITSSGFTGIGTTNPASLLELSSATGSATLVPTTLSITSTTSASDWSTASPWANIDFISKDASGTGVGPRARIGVMMANAIGSLSELTFSTNDGTSLGEKARIDYAGNLGVGTTNPGSIVDAVSPAYANGIRSQASTALGAGSGGGILAVTPNIPTAANQRLGVFAAGGYSSGTTYKYAAYMMGYSSEPWSATANGSFLIFSTVGNGTTAAIEKMRIDNAGNVAIGTTDPQGYKLAVNGSVIATAVTVKLYANWPDYVFKKGYKLPALSEVENYIAQNRHLPEVPSEEQVAKEGINLGEMNKVLVKKVEELTLYLIEQQDLIKQQNIKAKQLEERLNRLESLIHPH